MTECPYPIDPDEMDRESVRLGWMTEDERITAAYQRIFARQLRRRFFYDPDYRGQPRRQRR